jgi:hypothetical protein
MKRQIVKPAVVVLLFVSLLYYGAAWAVLSCFHEFDHSDRDLAAYEVAPSDHDHPNLECVGPQYHTEAMAESSSAPRVQRLVPFYDLTLGTATGDDASGLRLIAALEKVSLLSLPMSTPRYLSLSTLRI